MSEGRQEGVEGGEGPGGVVVGDDGHVGCGAAEAEGELLAFVRGFCCQYGDFGACGRAVGEGGEEIIDALLVVGGWCGDDDDFVRQVGEPGVDAA